MLTAIKNSNNQHAECSANKMAWRWIFWLFVDWKAAIPYWIETCFWCITLSPSLKRSKNQTPTNNSKTELHTHLELVTYFFDKQLEEKPRSYVTWVKQLTSTMGALPEERKQRKKLLKFCIELTLLVAVECEHGCDGGGDLKACRNGGESMPPGWLSQKVETQHLTSWN